jgi:hypothetical protein
MTWYGFDISGFERERPLGFREVPEILVPIIRALERLDEIKREEFYYGKRGIRRLRRLTRQNLLSNAVKREIIKPSLDYPGKIVGTPINVIPPLGESGPCTEILLVFIGEADSFELRLLETIEHCGVLCHGKTKYVIFYALKWNDAIWKRHEQSFKMINAAVVLKPFGRPQTKILYILSNALTT